MSMLFDRKSTVESLATLLVLCVVAALLPPEAVDSVNGSLLETQTTEPLILKIPDATPDCYRCDGDNCSPGYGMACDGDQRAYQITIFPGLDACVKDCQPFDESSQQTLRRCPSDNESYVDCGSPKCAEWRCSSRVETADSQNRDRCALETTVVKKPNQNSSTSAEDRGGDQKSRTDPKHSELKSWEKSREPSNPCFTGCLCKPGYARNSDGDCLLPQDCQDRDDRKPCSTFTTMFCLMPLGDQLPGLLPDWSMARLQLLPVDNETASTAVCDLFQEYQSCADGKSAERGCQAVGPLDRFAATSNSLLCDRQITRENESLVHCLQHISVIPQYRKCSDDFGDEVKQITDAQTLLADKYGIQTCKLLKSLLKFEPCGREVIQANPSACTASVTDEYLSDLKSKTDGLWTKHDCVQILAKAAEEKNDSKSGGGGGLVAILSQLLDGFTGSDVEESAGKPPKTEPPMAEPNDLFRRLWIGQRDNKTENNTASQSLIHQHLRPLDPAAPGRHGNRQNNPPNATEHPDDSALTIPPGTNSSAVNQSQEESKRPGDQGLSPVSATADADELNLDNLTLAEPAEPGVNEYENVFPGKVVDEYSVNFEKMKHDSKLPPNVAVGFAVGYGPQVCAIMTLIAMSYI